MRPGTLLRLRALKKIFAREIFRDSVVFDIGSYDGAVSDQLQKLVTGLDITVVDVDESGLQLAREKGLKTLRASVLELPIPDNSVDVVLGLDLIEHVADDSKAVGELGRVLKTGGKLILTTPKQDGVSFPFMSREKIAEVNSQWGHVRPGYSLQQLEDLLHSHNLAIEKSMGYFNFLTRFAYWLAYLSELRIPGRYVLYRLVTRLEPYIKYQHMEHIIIGTKIS